MKTKPVIGMLAPVAIEAASAEGNGPAKFNATFYTGGAMNIAGWDHPVVVDLAGLDSGKVLVANLDHDKTKRVGNFNVDNDGKTLVAHGTATAATAARQEVIDSAAGGYQWQASLEVSPRAIEEVPANKTAEANGQTFKGPIFITRKGTLKGFAFVSHGADDNTSVTIAAAAASHKGTQMKAEIKAWAEGMGIDIDNATPELIATIEANYEGKQPAKPAKRKADNPFEERKIEAKRRAEIRKIADRFIDMRNADLEEIEAIERMHDHAIEADMDAQQFRLEMYESTIPNAHPPGNSIRRDEGINNQVIEAAICITGRLPGHEKMFSDQTLQLAHDRFKNGIGLKQLFLLAAESNGHRASYSADVTLDVQRAAFNMRPNGQIHAQGWSTIEISSILSNSANKFVRDGWNSVEMTAMRLASIRAVRDFKTITTVSLVGDAQFEKLGAAGEIKHGTLNEVVYTGKADTYSKMLAITRQDIINDDLGALTAVPRRLGRGAGLKLNDIFWTAFLYGETSGFFSASHTAPTGGSNLNSGAADATLAGLTATELLFLNQIDPDGKPLGILPAIILVPNAIKATMAALLDPQSRLITGASATLSDVNVFAGKFRLESSAYMHNTSYTGYSTAAWYMMAEPGVLPTIEIQALNGRVEPTIDSADADFNVLGVQMRGYSDIGCSLQEYRVRQS